MIPIMEWIATVITGKTPCRQTVAKYREEGRISPPPKWLGRGWFVSPQAKLLMDEKPACKPGRKSKPALNSHSKKSLADRI